MNKKINSPKKLKYFLNRPKMKIHLINIMGHRNVILYMLEHTRDTESLTPC